MPATLFSPEFLLTSFVVVASPGTGAVYTIAAGLGRGPGAALLAALACTIGTLPHMAAAITGLAALLAQSPWAFDLVRGAGVLWLIWMGLNALRADGPLRVDAVQGQGRGARAVLIEGVAINLLNPKLSLFFLAFLPQFVGPANPAPTRAMLALSLVFVAMTFVVFIAYGLLAARMRDHVIARPRVMTWLRRGFAAAFLALGAKLAFAGR